MFGRCGGRKVRRPDRKPEPDNLSIMTDPGIAPPDVDSQARALAEVDRLFRPGGVGRLATLAGWLAGVQGRCPRSR